MEGNPRYALEERLNTISHALGIVFGVVGLFYLVEKGGGRTEFSTISIFIYSLSFIMLFSASTAYHAAISAKTKKSLQMIDHISIYVLIAGTYTPLALITLVHASGWTLFYIVWGIAAFGAVLKLFFTGKFELISLLLYLAMGWLIAFDYENVIEHVSSLGINFLIIGGAFYTLGIIFYAFEKLPFNHFIWHLFVLGGSLSHWFFIYFGVI